ncbi:MAG TPA: DUF4401 domain-containing protein [Allosphingosinicella sp.]|jgi:hypothetical protein
MSAQALWARLAAEGLVEGERPEPERPQSPWYVRTMLGIAGWIGALFLLGFVGAAFAFVMKDASAALFAGAACCGGALALYRSLRGQDFADQFALALSLAGQVLMIVGLAELMKPGGPPLYFAIAAMQAGLALAVPNFLHRVLTAAGAALALALGIADLSLHGLAAPLLCAALAWVWLEPARWARSGRLWRPIGYGLVLALLLVETFRLFGVAQWLDLARGTRGWMQSHGPLVGRVLTAALLVFVAVLISNREGHSTGSRTTLAAAAGAFLIGLFSLGAPGFASALLILLLGFAAGNRLLMALGVLGLLGFASHFYYSLHSTLLVKSGLLAATGLVLLAAHLILRRWPSGLAEPGHA